MNSPENPSGGAGPVVHRASVHWIVFAPSCVLVTVGALLTSDGAGLTSHAIGGLALICAVPTALIALSMKASTSVIITSNGVVARKGTVHSEQSELRIERIEGVDIRQSVFGRVFNYGTVVIRVTGDSTMELDLLTSPAEFSRQVKRVIAERETRRADVAK